MFSNFTYDWDPTLETFIDNPEFRMSNVTYSGMLGYRSGFNGDNYSYKTSISDWNEWYSEELRKSLWGIKIDRMEGLVGIGVTLEPYAKGVKKTYREEQVHYHFHLIFLKNIFI